jgi:hypothetical protein
MRISARLPVFFALTILNSTFAFADQKQLPWLPRVLSAKTAYFENRTGSDAVGNKALSQLRKWSKFQIVADRNRADLIFVLSADPQNGGKIILAGGQTATLSGNGRIQEDSIPDYNRKSQTRYAYLTVVDASTGETLWSGEHVWGGLLTGFNSVGMRLVEDLQKQTRKWTP